MDMSYATIPMIGGSKGLYSEKRSTYVVSSQNHPNDHAIYTVDTDLGLSIFFNDVSPGTLEISSSIEEEEGLTEEREVLAVKEREEGLWTLYFDGLVVKSRADEGVYILSPNKEFESLSYQLNFECTNNVAEYAALLLGLHALKDKKSKWVLIIRDS